MGMNGEGIEKEGKLEKTEKRMKGRKQKKRRSVASGGGQARRKRKRVTATKWWRRLVVDETGGSLSENDGKERENLLGKTDNIKVQVAVVR